MNVFSNIAVKTDIKDFVREVRVNHKTKSNTAIVIYWFV